MVTGRIEPCITCSLKKGQIDRNNVQPIVKRDSSAMIGDRPSLKKSPGIVLQALPTLNFHWPFLCSNGDQNS